MSFWKSIKQDVLASTVNSSSTALQPKYTYYFTVPNTTNATVGATYTNNGQTFTVLATIAPTTTTLTTTGTGAPATSGDLTKSGGTGDDTISFSAYSDPSLFVGTSESTLGVAGIQVTLYTDQNCTVYVEQSPEGTNWDISDSFDYKYQNRPNFGLTVQAVNSYFRVRVQNESTVNVATPFRLQSCLCPIVEAVPRALSAEGNLKVGVYEIEDEQGNKVRISPNGALDTCKITRLIGTAFSGTTIDANFWTSAVSANGSGVQTGGQFELRTITAPATSSPNGASALQSVRSARYINGIPNYCRIQADYGGVGVANNTKRWGCFTGTAGSPTDGAMFELIDSVPSIATYNGGVANRISNGSFNGDYGTTLNAIPSGVQTFEVIFNNRYVYFFFNKVLVHEITASTAPWSSTLSLPLRAENYNTGSSTTDTSLKIRSFIIMRFGEPVSRPHWKNTAGALAVANGILKRGAGTLQKVVNNTNNAGTLTLYDSLTNSNPIGAIDLAKVVGSVNYDLDFYTGLTIVQTGASSDTTVVFE